MIFSFNFFQIMFTVIITCIHVITHMIRYHIHVITHMIRYHIIDIFRASLNTQVCAVVEIQKTFICTNEGIFITVRNLLVEK